MKKRGYEFEREQGKVCGRFHRGKREGENDVIISKKKEKKNRYIILYVYAQCVPGVQRSKDGTNIPGAGVTM